MGINRCLYGCFLDRLISFIKIFLFGRPKISILIPFATNDPYRKKVFKWLLEYWKHELPDAEIIVGRSKGKVFCKGEALNYAFRRSSGKVIAMLDADAYIEGRIIEKAADLILENLDNHLWFVPYRKLYRLNKETTLNIIESNPQCPKRITCPPPKEYLDDDGHKSKYGHHFMAMAAVFPREAIETLGCWDTRFIGWGSEDVCFLRALDTLFGRHKTLNECIFHLWHPFLGKDYTEKKWEQTRKWDGQEKANSNNWLSIKYHKATNKPSEMRRLVDEGCKHCYGFCLCHFVWDFICSFSEEKFGKFWKSN